MTKDRASILLRYVETTVDLQRLQRVSASIAEIEPLEKYRDDLRERLCEQVAKTTDEHANALLAIAASAVVGARS